MSDEILFEIQRSLGRIEEKIDNHAKTLEKHIEDDDKLVVRLYGDGVGVGDITKLQLNAAKQKGFFTALAGTGSALGAGIGYLIERLTLGHHG